MNSPFKRVDNLSFTGCSKSIAYLSVVSGNLRFLNILIGNIKLMKICSGCFNKIADSSLITDNFSRELEDATREKEICIQNSF